MEVLPESPSTPVTPIGAAPKDVLLNVSAAERGPRDGGRAVRGAAARDQVRRVRGEVVQVGELHRRLA